MAIDKAVDSAVLDANLTSIADAIRVKAGTSDKLAFPAGFADAIAAIEAGGGGATIEVGTFTVASDVKYYNVPITLSKVPKVIFYADLGDGTTGEVLPPTNYSVSAVFFSDIFASDPVRTKNRGLSVYKATKSYVDAYWHTYGNSYYNNAFITATNNTLTLGGDSNSYYFRSGRTYIYMIIVE